MPKKPIDYSRCCIYKIEHIENNNLLYIGHTTEFNKRKGHHKSNCKNENSNVYNIKLYQMIRNNGGWDMFKMIEVEKYICNDRREAEKRENELMKDLKANMNMRNNFPTNEEIKERNKNYYEENKVTFNSKRKEHYQTNKEYREQQLEKHKNHYYKNKATILEKVKCDCGCQVNKQHLKRHEKTKKHIDLMNEKNK